MRCVRAHTPHEHKRPPRAYVAAIPHFAAFFALRKTQNLLANLHTVLRFSTCARRKLCRSGDMLQNTGGSGRFEHLLFSQQSGFFSCALKTCIPQNHEKRCAVCIFAHTLYTIQYNVFGLQQSQHTIYTTRMTYGRSINDRLRRTLQRFHTPASVKTNVAVLKNLSLIHISEPTRPY